MDCSLRGKCGKRDAKNYQTFHRQRIEQLKEKWYCNYEGGFCTDNKCGKYTHCSKLAKGKYTRWRKAYEESDRKELGKLFMEELKWTQH